MKKSNSKTSASLPRLKITENHWVFLLLLSLATVLLFIITFKGELIYDDRPVIISDPDITYWHFWDLWQGWGRSTRTLSLMVDYYFFGYSPTGYHFQNILWHLIAVLLLYVMFVMVINNRLLSFLGALLFAVHPIHVEVVANISARKESLCMVFYLLSFITYLIFLKKSGNKRWAWLSGSLIFWYLALNSKQVAIVLPFSLVAYELIFLTKEKRFLAKNILALAICVTVGSLSLVTFLFSTLDMSRLQDSHTLAGYIGDPTFSSIASYSARAFWNYVCLLFFPISQSPSYIVDLSTANDLVTFLSWPALLLAILATYYMIRVNSLAAFGIIWFIINYAPVSNLIPSVYLVADRYMYIPSAGFCLVIVVACNKLQKELICKYSYLHTKKILTALFAIFFVLFSVRTYSYNTVWRNDLTLWDNAVKVTPKSFKAYLVRGESYKKLGKLRLALHDFNKAIEINPNISEAYIGRSTIHIKLGNYWAAINDSTKAVAIDPYHIKAYINRGGSYYNLGKYRQAIEDYSRVIKSFPNYPVAYNNRGNAYDMLGKHQEAIRDYQKALRLDPNDASTYYNLGIVYSKLGKHELSRRYTQKATSLNSR